AEARPGHLLDGEALGAQAGGVHQVLGLVVGDDAHLAALPRVVPGQPRQRRRLARPQKAAHHHEAQSVHRRPHGPGLAAGANPCSRTRSWTFAEHANSTSWRAKSAAPARVIRARGYVTGYAPRSTFSGVGATLARGTSRIGWPARAASVASPSET